MKQILYDVRRPNPPDVKVFVRFFTKIPNSPLNIWQPFGSLAQIENTTPHVYSPVSKFKTTVMVIGEVLWGDTPVFRTEERTLAPGDRFEMMFSKAKVADS